jgi:hypothetical protein
MVHLKKIPEKATPELIKALDNGYKGLFVWDSAKRFIAAIEKELYKRENEEARNMA